MNKLILGLLCFHLSLSSYGEVPYYIFSIKQNISMGIEKEEPIKNYYINMGQLQGIKKGTILEVYRRLLRSNPYSREFQIEILRPKIGELIVEYADKKASIASLHQKEFSLGKLIYDIDGFILGDEVEVKIIKLNTEDFL